MLSAVLHRSFRHHNSARPVVNRQQVQQVQHLGAVWNVRFTNFCFAGEKIRVSLRNVQATLADLFRVFFEVLIDGDADAF